MQKKIVLHFINSFTIGGAEIALTNSFEALNKTFDYYIVVFRKGDEVFFEDFINKNNLKIFELNTYSSLVRFLKFYKSNSINLVISSLWRSHLILFLIRIFLKKGCWMLFIHNTGFAHVIDKLVHQFMAKQATFIVADSKEASDKTRLFSSRTPVKTLPFIFSSNLTILERKQSIQRNKEYKFVYLGRITEVKKPKEAVVLVSQLRCKGYNVSLDLYGADEKGMLGKTLQKAEELGIADRVSYKGVVAHNQVHKTLSRYDFFILLSQYEGMAMSVVEAMQSGVVPIVTPVGEIKNYAIHKENAIIFNREDKNQILIDLMEVLDNFEIYTNLRNKALQTFENQETYVDGLCRIINEVC